LLSGLISNNDDIRALGCMGVGAICEFGSTDPDIAALRAKVSPALRSRLTERLKEGQAAGEIDRSLDCATAASFIQLTMQSIQLAARGGIDATSLAGSSTICRRTPEISVSFLTRPSALSRGPLWTD